jgi:uncharacterized iron-regulated membrane protein
MGFWRRPQPTRLRRVVFQIHLWTGIAVGLYVLVISLTGSALMFRIDLQRTLNPELFVPQKTGPLVSPETVLQRLEQAYPQHRIAGIDAPTDRRPTYLAYVSSERDFLTVLLDPVDGRVLGLLPKGTFATTLQDLHFDLLAGRTGRIVNGMGAALLLLLVLTGLVIWWPGSSRWRRGLKVDFGQPPLRINWELHGAAGFWTLTLLLIWSVTGLYFAFPQSFRGAVNAVSTLSVPVRPRSQPPSANATPLSRVALLERAQVHYPGRPIGRIVIPAQPHDTFQVLFAEQSPTRAGEALDTVYVDHYSGALITPPVAQRSLGDVVLQWVGPLHTGSFGGLPVRLAWCLLGLTPALLFVTGFISWWTRVVRPRRAEVA